MGLGKATLAIYGLCCVESLLSCAALDKLRPQAYRHDPNQELVGQGLANLIARASRGPSWRKMTPYSWLAGELATGNIASFIAGFLGVAGSCCRLLGLLPGVFLGVDPATLPGTRQRVGSVAGSAGPLSVAHLDWSFPAVLLL